MSGTIAWINDHWGQPWDLNIPLSDRGLQLADGVFETVLVHNGHPQLLNAHLARWCAGAEVLGMAPPPSADSLEPLINEAISRSGLQASDGALRLNWSRDGAMARGIQIPTTPPDPEQHRFWLTLNPHQPSFATVSTWISRHERRNADSQLSHCKTFAYGQSIQVRREAKTHGADEGLMRSTRGDLCCASTANLLVRRQGQWLTPPLSSGCLPGVMRHQLLEKGLAQEQIIDAIPENGDSWLLINSLDCRVVRSVNEQPLDTEINAAALWEKLL